MLIFKKLSFWSKQFLNLSNRFIVFQSVFGGLGDFFVNNINEQKRSDLPSSQRVHYRHQVLVTSKRYSAIEEIKNYLEDYDPIIVNRL